GKGCERDDGQPVSRRLELQLARPGAPGGRRLEQVAGVRQQARVVDDFAPFDVARKEVGGEVIAGEIAERVLQILERIGARDQPGRRSISGAEALPEQAHVVVERDAPVAAYAKGEIEPERNGRSLRVVRDEGPAAI